MLRGSLRFVLFIIVISLSPSEGYLESLATSVTGLVPPPVVRSEPFSALVTFQCGYRNRYFTNDNAGGKWVTDDDPRASCLKGKLDILKYCRKVYPTLRVTNIVESSHEYEIPGWCKLEGQPCKWTFKVKPFRCVVGAFESEALLVPERCHFGHVDDQKKCKEFDYWNQTARGECEKWNGRSGVLKSFAMLEPCGLDMFSGVEFVCCPKEEQSDRSILAASAKVENGSNNSGAESELPSIDLKVKVKLNNEQAAAKSPLPTEDDDEDDDESSDDDDDNDDEDTDEDGDDSANENESSQTIERVNAGQSVVRKRILTSTLATATAATSTPKSTDGSRSSDSKDSEDDSSDEVDENNTEPYFRVADPDREYSSYRMALDRLEKRHREKVTAALRKLSEAESKYQQNKEHDVGHVEEMKAEFRRTMSSLEKAHHDERHRIEEVHEARVSAASNARKREAMLAYRRVLTMSSSASSGGRQSQARSVLRALQAYIKAEEKDRVHGLTRYRYLLRTDRDEAATMRERLLKKLREIDSRVNGLMAMMNDVPGLAEKVKPVAMEFWQRFRDENTPGRVDDSLTWIGAPENAEHLLELYKKQNENDFDKDFADSQYKHHTDRTGSRQPSPSVKKESDIRLPVSQPAVLYAEKWDTKKREKVVLQEHEDVKHPHSFALKESLHHEAAVKEEISQEGGGNGGTSHVGYAILTVVGVTMLVALAVGIIIRRRSSARGQGFVAVDATTPEERHISGMQVNGYENPTYSYFEAKP